VHERLAERARTPRYTIPEAAELVGRPANTLRRWSLGHRRTYQGAPAVDEPLISVDGKTGPGERSLSFLNLLELQMLSRYRSEAALQAIRRALSFAAEQLGEPRPLITVEFRIQGGELFTRFAETPDGRELLLNASRGGQLTHEKFVESVERGTQDIDYDDVISRRWWFKTRSVPLYVDMQVASGHPITAETGVRVDAIASRHRDGYSVADIQHDTGATETEVVAVVAAALAA
jgi:uncharacterized protein (DUF433 family)/transposase-like protein